MKREKNIYELTERQVTIATIVREQGPISGNAIAEQVGVTRAALRLDLSILVMGGFIGARPKMGYFYVGKPSFDLTAKALQSYKVKEVLSRPVVVQPLTTIQDTVTSVFTEDVGTILVGENDYLVGVVSRKDLLRVAIGQSDLKGMPVSMIMTPVSKVVFAEPEELVLEAAQRMIDVEIDCLPVVVKETIEGKRKLRIVGRLSKTNITKVFVECGSRYRFD